MSYDFYCGNQQYTVSNNSLSLNGEIVAQGSIEVRELLLGRPASIMIQSINDCICIKTDMVTAVLPQHERFKGKVPSKRKFRMRMKRRDMEITAISRQHAKTLLGMFM